MLQGELEAKLAGMLSCFAKGRSDSSDYCMTTIVTLQVF